MRGRVLGALQTMAAAAATVLALTVGSASASPAPAAATSLDGVPAFGHVFVIIGENTEITHINSSNAPYITGTLKPASAWLTSYFALTHFSEANYVGMTSGQYTSCEQNDGSPASCNQSVPNLFDQLDGAGVSWHVWAESMPAPCYLSSAGSDKTFNHYAPKHNPAIFFADIEGAGGIWSATTQSAECTTNDVPAGTTDPNDMSAFNSALASGSVPQFNYVVPNICEDGHDNCPPVGNRIRQFDDFVAREAPRIESSPAFGSDGVLIVTYDEGNSNQGPGAGKFAGGGNVMFAVNSPLAVPGVYTTGSYNHYSLLRTLEEGYGISTPLGGAAQASSINQIWQP